MTTHYSKADGTALTTLEVKARTTKSNRMRGVYKAALTRAAKLITPPNCYGLGLSPVDYVKRFDKANSLRPLPYAWQENPRAHYGVIEMDVVEEGAT